MYFTMLVASYSPPKPFMLNNSSEIPLPHVVIHGKAVITWRNMKPSKLNNQWSCFNMGSVLPVAFPFSLHYTTRMLTIDTQCRHAAMCCLVWGSIVGFLNTRPASTQEPQSYIMIHEIQLDTGQYFLPQVWGQRSTKKIKEHRLCSLSASRRFFVC